jgi:hypothetical protein
MRFHVSFAGSLTQLEKSEDDFAVLLEHGSIRGIVFGPDEIDGQEPHAQDEIMRGSGEFELEDKVVYVGMGDFLFAPAGAYHRLP